MGIAELSKNVERGAGRNKVQALLERLPAEDRDALLAVILDKEVSDKALWRLVSQAAEDENRGDVPEHFFKFTDRTLWRFRRQLLAGEISVNGL